jgi:hypothetical protein
MVCGSGDGDGRRRVNGRAGRPAVIEVQDEALQARAVDAMTRQSGRGRGVDGLGL